MAGYAMVGDHLATLAVCRTLAPSPAIRRPLHLREIQNRTVAYGRRGTPGIGSCS